MTTKSNGLLIKPYNIKELAEIYNMSSRTMTNWLTEHKEAIGKKIGRYYSAKQVKTIFEKLGLPGEINDQD